MAHCPMTKVSVPPHSDGSQKSQVPSFPAPVTARIEFTADAGTTTNHGSKLSCLACPRITSVQHGSGSFGKSSLWPQESAAQHLDSCLAHGEDAMFCRPSKCQAPHYCMALCSERSGPYKAHVGRAFGASQGIAIECPTSSRALNRTA